MNAELDRMVTRRLEGERLDRSHLADLLRMDCDPRIMNNLGGVRSEAETGQYLRRNIEHWDEHGFGLWMIRRRTDHRFVGRAALRRMPLGGNDENVIGYAFLPEFWGLGYATEIVSEIVRLAFEELGLSDVAAGARLDNAASQRVLEKVGGRLEREVFYKNAPHALYRIRNGQMDR